MAEIDPDLNNPKNGKRTRIPELSTIEINGTSKLKKWIEESRALSVIHATEIEWAAEEIEAVLVATGDGNPWLFGLDVKARARRIAKRAFRASELQRGSAKELVALWHDFLVQFAPAIKATPKKKKKIFNFED